MEYNQPELPFTGNHLRDIGMAMAAENAENKNIGWNERALELLKQYCEKNKDEFLTEFFRSWAEVNMNLPTPPDARAYGSIMTKARKAGIIKHCGWCSVTNPQAHSRPGSKWRAVK